MSFVPRKSAYWPDPDRSRLVEGLLNAQPGCPEAIDSDKRRSEAVREKCMKQLFVAAVIAVSVVPLVAQQPTAKKPIAHDVYDGWKSIQGTKLSRDGIWVAYALIPQDGDGE